MNFQTIRFADNNDLPLVLILPSYAATAWYHKRLSPQMQAKSVEQIAEEARNFAANEYTPAMLRIDTLSDDGPVHPCSRSLVRLPVSAVSLSKGIISALSLANSIRNCSASERRTDRPPRQPIQGHRPRRRTATARIWIRACRRSDRPIRRPLTRTFAANLGYKSDVEYYILGGGISSPWNYNVTNNMPIRVLPLKDAMAKNPYMKVFVAPAITTWRRHSTRRNILFQR